MLCSPLPRFLGEGLGERALSATRVVVDSTLASPLPRPLSREQGRRPPVHDARARGAKPTVVGCWLLVVGCRLSVVGCWLMLCSPLPRFLGEGLGERALSAARIVVDSTFASPLVSCFSALALPLCASFLASFEEERDLVFGSKRRSDERPWCLCTAHARGRAGHSAV